MDWGQWVVGIGNAYVSNMLRDLEFPRFMEIRFGYYKKIILK